MLVLLLDRILYDAADGRPWSFCECKDSPSDTSPCRTDHVCGQIIITGFGFTVLETQLLAMVLGAFIIITLFSSSWLAKKTQQNTIVMACFCLP